MAWALCGALLPVVRAQVAGTTAPAYQDRFMEGVSTQEDSEGVEAYRADGLPRSWSLEASQESRTSAGAASQSGGVRWSGYTDTLHHGSLSGSVNLATRNGGAGNASVVLRQIGMPFDGGWLLDNTLGMLNLPLLDLARGSQRISLTTPAMQGLATHLRRGPDFSILAATGQAGSYVGFPVPGFSLTQGRYSLAGYADGVRLEGLGHWQWGAMAARASQVSSVLSPTATGVGVMDAEAQYAGLRREWAGGGQGEGFHVQANWVRASNTGSNLAGLANPAAAGWWVEGGAALGAHRHTVGLFRLEPGLGWLDLPLANDLVGGYWRHVWRTRQWSVESSAEQLNSVTGAAPQGHYVSTSLRYQFSSSTSYGGALNVRRYGIHAQGGQLFTQVANAWGSTRLQWDGSSSESGDRQSRLQLDHDWSFLQDTRLSTSAFVDRAAAAGQADTQGSGLAVSAGWQAGRWNASSTLQGRWSAGAQTYTANATLSWRLAPGWSLQSSAYALSGGSAAQNLAQSPLAAPAVVLASTQDSGISVMLRYEEQAGQAQAPLGGPPGTAAGRVTGTIYLDENRNGRRDASERGAANVTVVLDGRFTTQTDAQGLFEFAYVAAGPRVLTVIIDNLPLPWALEKDGRTEVRVFARGTASVDIGAQRLQ